jgi:hypothetical protein
VTLRPGGASAKNDRAEERLGGVNRIVSLRHQMTVKQRRGAGLPKLIGRFKLFLPNRIETLRQTPILKSWQPNYWERIVRKEPQVNLIRVYIRKKLAPTPVFRSS